MELKIPKPDAAIPATEDISGAKRFEELGPIEMYRGSLILALEEDMPPQRHIYIFTIELDGDGDPVMGMTKLSPQPNSNDSFRLAKKAVDAAIASNKVIEQDNGSVYVPDFEDKFFSVVYKHAQHLEDKKNASIGQSVDNLVKSMHTTGGRVTYNLNSSPVSGFVVEIFFDLAQRKNRARANDGTHGVHNAAFPTNKREDGAVYIVSDLSWGGLNYVVSSRTTMWRIR